MLRKRMTAVVPKRNLFGRRARRRITMDEVLQYGLDFDKEELLDLLDRGYRLPILEGGAESNINTVMANPVYFPRNIVVSTDVTVLQGDMVYWDGVAYTLRQLTDPTQVAYVAGGIHGFVGVAQSTNVPAVYPDPAAGTPSEKLGGVTVQRGGTVKLHSTTGEGNLFPFEPVTVGASQQTVSRSGQTAANRVGLVIVPPPTNARSGPGATPAPETVASGTDVEVWIESKFPTTVLL